MRGRQGKIEQDAADQITKVERVKILIKGDKQMKNVNIFELYLLTSGG